MLRTRAASEMSAMPRGIGPRCPGCRITAIFIASARGGSTGMAAGRCLASARAGTRALLTRDPFIMLPALDRIRQHFVSTTDHLENFFRLFPAFQILVRMMLLRKRAECTPYRRCIGAARNMQVIVVGPDSAHDSILKAIRQAMFDLVKHPCRIFASITIFFQKK